MSRINWRGLQKYAIMFVLLGLVVLFSLVSPYFLTVRNLTNIVIQTTYFIIVGVGLSFVMIGGGIDLSVGYQMSLVGIVTAMLMVVYHLPVWLAVVGWTPVGHFLGVDQRPDRDQDQDLSPDCHPGDRRDLPGNFIYDQPGENLPELSGGIPDYYEGEGPGSPI